MNRFAFNKQTRPVLIKVNFGLIHDKVDIIKSLHVNRTALIGECHMSIDFGSVKFIQSLKFFLC